MTEENTENCFCSSSTCGNTLEDYFLSSEADDDSELKDLFSVTVWAISEALYLTKTAASCYTKGWSTLVARSEPENCTNFSLIWGKDHRYYFSSNPDSYALLHVFKSEMLLWLTALWMASVCLTVSGNRRNELLAKMLTLKMCIEL